MLDYGALPVQLEPQAVQTVSATLGQDSLKAGVVAGIIGLLLVVLFMLLYYRRSAWWCSPASASRARCMWSIVSWLGETRGLALTLAGVTGIIVSIGVTVDSYVVFFERLKDEVRSGEPCARRPSKGFTGACRTILAADLVSLIGAAVLYCLTVGSVRGFAFFLGLSTLLDLVRRLLLHPPGGHPARRSGRLFAAADVLGVRHGEATGASSDVPWSSAAMTDARRAPTADDRARQASGTGLYHGETHFDFVGQRRHRLHRSPGVLIVHQRCSRLFTRASTSASTSRAAWPGSSRPTNRRSTTPAATLEDNGIDAGDAKIQTLRGSGGERLRVQVGDQHRRERDVERRTQDARRVRPGSTSRT